MHKSGFTLLELLMAFAILAAVAVATVPRFVQRMQPTYERKQFIADLNNLLALGWQQAVLTNTIHAISVDFGTRRIQLERQTTRRDPGKEKGAFIYEPVTGAFRDTVTRIPAALSLRSVYIERQQELTRARKEKAQFWFYIVPEGLAQDVIMNLDDTGDMVNGKPRRVGLVLNPFRVRFKEYDHYQKP